MTDKINQTNPNMKELGYEHNQKVPERSVAELYRIDYDRKALFPK